MNFYNSGYIPYNPYNQYMKTVTPAVQYGPCLINQGPAQDVFQKSTLNAAQGTQGVRQSAPVSGVWDEKRIEAIYNKTYETVMAQNPITRELNISKPALNFNADKDENESTIAKYKGGYNEITAQAGDFFANDLYLCKMTDENGELIEIQVFEERFAENYAKKHPEFKITKEKLTDSEKELYISSVFAHELRHCIQFHLIASTEGCMDECKTQLKNLEADLQELISTKKELAELKGEPYIPSEYDEELKKLSYGLNYKPKKVFDKNTAFKYSLSPSDNRYLLVKDHLYALSRSKKQEESAEGYYNDPMEIDAYNYEAEFLMTETGKHKGNTVRKEIADGLILSVGLNIFDENFPFIRK